MYERWRLLRGAIGGLPEVRGKLRRIARTAAIRLDRGELDRRLSRLHELGVIDAIPTRRQLAFAARDIQVTFRRRSCTAARATSARSSSRC